MTVSTEQDGQTYYITTFDTAIGKGYGLVGG